MAKTSRSQRRARRAAQTETGVAERPRARPPQLRAADVAVEGESRRVPSVPGGGVRRFVVESWGELQKVEWPGQNQVLQGTVVVLIACLIVGVFLYASDEVFKRLVEQVLLR